MRRMVGGRDGVEGSSITGLIIRSEGSQAGYSSHIGVEVRWPGHSGEPLRPPFRPALNGLVKSHSANLGGSFVNTRGLGLQSLFDHLRQPEPALGSQRL